MKELISKYEKLLPVGTSLSTVEAEKRASEFLVAMATVTNLRHELSAGKIKLTSVHTAVYAEQMAKGTAKTVTENKLTAEASKEYTTAREDLEQIDNDLAYLKAYYDIFQNAHVFFRMLAKGDNQ